MKQKRQAPARKNKRAVSHAQARPASPAVKFFLISIIVLGAVGAGYLGAAVFLKAKDMPDISLLERYEPIEAVQIFDRNDHLIAVVEGDEDRRVVPLNQVSPTMRQAMLAAEDHHFFEHHGINFVSIFRAFVVNMQAGHVVEGGSTITQQLVKNLFFNQAGRTFDRKLKEAILAFELEQRYSKEKILELYLNQVYFGSNAYGIERAAARYFNKPAATLSLAESAFLAGLVKAPSELGNVHNRPEALARQHEILDKMVEYGYVTSAQRNKAIETKLVFRNGQNPFSRYPYYISYVLQVLREKFSENEMRQQGLKVYTNLDPKAQQIAEKTLSEAIAHAPKGVSQAALVSLSVADGSVLAMVGGVGNFWKNQFNRAVNPHTVGSSFKPFVYLTAFLQGTATPDSPIEDSPLVVHQGWGLPDYVPKNFDHKFYGRITVRKALALSRNIPALRTAQKVGIEKVIETARLAGVKAKLDANLSLALGSSAISPLEMAGAYSTFARGGIAIAPKVLRRVENNRGQMLLVYDEEKNKAFPPEPVAALVDVLQDVVKYGTGTQAKLADRPVAGKTGTADAGKDIWFIGFTPDLVTAIWGGNDEDLPIPGHNVTGGVVMAKIWHTYNEAYYKEYPTPPGSFPLCDYKLALQKSVAGETKDGVENKEETDKQDKSAASKSKSDTQGNVESILNQPKVEEIEMPKENLPVDNLNDNSQTAIQQSSMPPPAPAIKPAPRLAPPLEAIPAPAPAISQPATPFVPQPSPQRLVPAKLTNTGQIEQINSAPASKRLYPYQQ